MSDSGLINFNVTPSTNSMRLVARTPSDDTTETIEYKIVSHRNDKKIDINTDKPLEYMVELTESFLYTGDNTIQSKMSGFLLRVSQSELKEEGKQQLKAWMEATGQLIGTLEGIKDATGKSVFIDTIEEVKQWMKKFEDSKYGLKGVMVDFSLSVRIQLNTYSAESLGDMLSKYPIYKDLDQSGKLKIEEDAFVQLSIYCFRRLISNYRLNSDTNKHPLTCSNSTSNLAKRLLYGLCFKGENLNLMDYIDARRSHLS